MTLTYVQEIGRGARKKEIQGKAMTDFTEKDLKYVRMLYGISGIRQYQLKEMMRKIHQIFEEKQSRNFLVSVDTFAYLFEDRDLENKVKNGMMLIAKDLEMKYGFPVLIARPKMLFTKNYINVPVSIEEEFMKRFGEFISNIPPDEPRTISALNKSRSGDVIVYNTGKIVEMDMASLWEKKFSDLTFAEFKRSFFEGELFEFENGENVAPRIHLLIHYNENPEKTLEKVKEYSLGLAKTFRILKEAGGFFLKPKFREVFRKQVQLEKMSNEMLNVLLDIFVTQPSQNIGFKQQINPLKFVQERRKEGSMENEYRIINNNFNQLRSYYFQNVANSFPNFKDKTFSTYIAVKKGKRRNQLLDTAIFLELFGLASYELAGGKNTEIFVRVNDSKKLRYLSREAYQNSILLDIKKRQDTSQIILGSFMLKEFSTEERWEIIEDYFLGREEGLFRKLGFISE